MASWSTLPEHIVEIFIEKIDSHRDLVTFGSVCKLWHSVVTKNSNRLPHKLPLARCCPYDHPITLLFQPSESVKSSYFYSLTEKRAFDGHTIPEIKNKWIVGSSQGWLVTIEADGTLIHLLNPLTGMQIPLPSLRCFPKKDLERFEQLGFKPLDQLIVKVIITSDPVARKDDCLVIAMVGILCSLYYCRIGGTCWKSIEWFPLIFLRDVVVSNGLVYTVNYLGLLYCLKVSNTDTIKIDLIASQTDLAVIGTSSLIESSGDLFLVKHIQRDDNPNKIDSFQVFKMVQRRIPVTISFQTHSYRGICTHIWKHIDSIGNMSLFLGSGPFGGSFRLESSTESGIKGSCVYFIDRKLRDDHANTDNSSKHLHDIRVFHLEEGIVENIATLTGDSSSFQLPAIWLEPNLE